MITRLKTHLAVQIGFKSETTFTSEEYEIVQESAEFFVITAKSDPVTRLIGDEVVIPRENVIFFKRKKVDASTDKSKKDKTSKKQTQKKKSSDTRAVKSSKSRTEM